MSINGIKGINSFNFNCNNLGKSSSPYLQQHKDNPVHWQEWNKDVLEYAKATDKPMFVSVGYATCHWCHVMAKEAFSDNEVAGFLNKNFVCIKVDREQRPDIDRYLMSFIMETQGHGGWPLNVFMTHEIKPYLAVTYVPVKNPHGMSFIQLLEVAKQAYVEMAKHMNQYIPIIEEFKGMEETPVTNQIKQILSKFDEKNAGFGSGHKFPPHCTLLFLLSYYENIKNKAKDEKVNDEKVDDEKTKHTKHEPVNEKIKVEIKGDIKADVRAVIENTLDIMAMRGLHDHLQGGFYRYSVDRQWTMPHFEKMLYDQAMMLWIYSAAYKVLKKEQYKTIVEELLKCLSETFECNEDNNGADNERGGVYFSAHDADTEHEEGATYLWREDELKQILTDSEFKQFKSVYEISEQGSEQGKEKGNFEDKIHLVKSRLEFIPAIEAKLLQIRKKRKQPFTDKKIVTSWNALTGIALLTAYRCVGIESAKQKALQLFDKLIETHYVNGQLLHSSIGNQVQHGNFLDDYACMLSFATYIYEETGQKKDLIGELYQKLQQFKKQGKETWIESLNEDFIEIPAEQFDNPIPSSSAMAELAVLRIQLMNNEPYDSPGYKPGLSFDFYNFVEFIRKGNWHVIHCPKIPWEDLPLNTVQFPGEMIIDCYANKCAMFKTKEDLMNYIKKD